MLSMVEGIGTLATTELDARPSPEVTTPGEQTIVIEAVDNAGDPVAGATVVVSSDTARLDQPATAQTDEDGTVRLSLDPTLPSNRAEGVLEIRIKPPAAGEYVDRRDNTRILVVAE